MDKLDMNKMKESFSGVEKLARRYPIEILTAIAILIATLSAWAGFFVGTLGWSIFFLAIGAIVGIFFPIYIDKGIKAIYSYSIGVKKMGLIIAEIIKIGVALFLPFLYFGFLGLMAGTSYHYYTRFMQGGQKGSKAA